MRFGELLATSLSEIMVGATRRRFLSAPTSPRPPLAPGPPCSLARSPKAGERASRRTWPRTPWLGERPEADDRYRVHKTLHEQHDRSDVQSPGVAQVPDDRTMVAFRSGRLG